MFAWAIARRSASALVTVALLVVVISGGLNAQSATQPATEVGNKPTELLSPGLELIRADDAQLTRHDDRLTLEISMDVPVPGTYVYPEGVGPERQAAPEVFTAWMFIFNHPEACTSGTEPPLVCGPDDFSEAAKGGVYGVAGHVTSIDHSGGAFEIDRAGDGRMTLVGEVVVGDPQRPNSPPNSINFPLENPAGAEVHVAVAPHGQLDPAKIATELYEPAGNPDCGCWWGAFFAPPGD